MLKLSEIRFFFEGLYPDWATNDPKNTLGNTKEAMDLAEQWLGVPQVSGNFEI
jgi:hypothetical protein